MTTVVLIGLLLTTACSPAFQTKFTKSLASASAPADLAGIQLAPNKLHGEALYASKCAACHGPLERSPKLGATKARIASALESIPDMGVLKNQITGDEVEAIAWTLAGRPSVSASERTPFACVAGRPAGRSETRRLTRYELSNTLKDLLGSGFFSSIEPYVDLVPADSVVLGFDNFDSNVSATHVESYNALAREAAGVVSGNLETLAALAGNCARETAVNEACFANFIASFGLKAFRRPLAADEAAGLLALAKEAGIASRDAKEGFNVLLYYFLQAPQFLYRVEENATLAAGGDGSTYELTPHELASRLSYLIWGTMPDEALFAKAASGQLKDKTKLQAEIDRLMASAKAATHFRRFYMQWLDPGTMSGAGLSFSQAFLGGLTTSGLASDMTRELQDFVDYVVWAQKGSFKDLMSSDVVFPRTQALATIYQTPVWSEGQLPLRAPAGQRSGVLTHAAMLAFSGDNAHPILRGIVVQKKMLCGILPPPKAGALPPDALKPPPLDGTATIRHLYEQKTAANECQRCHSQINPYGFALGNFDNLGRYQTHERIFASGGTLLGTHPIDSAASLPLDLPGTELVTGGAQFGEALGQSPTAAACFVNQWYQYAAGRVEEDNDGCSMNGAYDALTKSGGSIQEMIRATALSPSFSVRKVQ